MTIEIVLGSDLNPETISLMNRQRVVEYGQNTKDFEKNERESIFFFYQTDGAIRSFGMLKPVTLMIDGHHQDIFGIGNIMAMEKSKGHGQTLMLELQNYLTNQTKIGMGFCVYDVHRFYERCGFQMDQAVTARLRYKYAEQTGDPKMLDQNLWTLYTVSGLELAQQIMQSKEFAYVDVPFW